MRKIKKGLMIIAIAALMISPNAMAEEEKKECPQFEFEDVGNPVLGALLVPVRVVLAFMHLPRCLIHHFPVNKPKDEEENN